MKKYHTSKKHKTYDYIIIGAGGAGSVIAGRLAEQKNITVLLLESGQDNRIINENKNINDNQKALILSPSSYASLWPNYHVNPLSNNCGQLEITPTHYHFNTTKQNTRFYHYPRGNGAGGSTNHNALVDGRGSGVIYDRIAQQVGDKRWSAKYVMPFFKKMESYNVPNSNKKIHGTNGWLQVKHCKMENEFQADLFQTAVDDLGIPLRFDFSDPNQRSGIGFADIQVNQEGERSYAFKDLVQPILDSQDNLVVKFNTHVTRVLLKKNHNDKFNAYGVEVLQKPYVYSNNITGNQSIMGSDGCITETPDKTHPNTITYYAKREIIICGGAIMTPQILMLSGLGPKEHLHEKDIHCYVDLPGVGTGLMDHQEVSVIFELDPTKFMWRWQATLLLPNVNEAPVDVQPIIKKYADPSSLTENFAPIALDWHSGIDPINLKDPDLHIQPVLSFFFDFDTNFVQLPGDDEGQADAKETYLPDPNDPLNPIGIPNTKNVLIQSQFDVKNPRVFLAFFAEELKPSRAEGSIQLNSNNPTDAAILDLGLWKDDIANQRLAKAIKLIRSIMSNPRMMKYSRDPNDYNKFELYPGSILQTEQDLETYTKTWSSFGHHISGTARMGKKHEKNTVVDSKLRVKGVNNLRVADTSIYPFPHIHGYNTSRAAYLVGEVAANLIKKKWK